MVGALNKLPIAIAGMIFFDAVVSVGSIGGIVLAYIAGIVYCISKFRETQHNIQHGVIANNERKNVSAKT